MSSEAFLAPAPVAEEPHRHISARTLEHFSRRAPPAEFAQLASVGVVHRDGVVLAFRVLSLNVDHVKP